MTRRGPSIRWSGPARPACELESGRIVPVWCRRPSRAVTPAAERRDQPGTRARLRGRVPVNRPTPACDSDSDFKFKIGLPKRGHARGKKCRLQVAGFNLRHAFRTLRTIPVRNLEAESKCVRVRVTVARSAAAAAAAESCPTERTGSLRCSSWPDFRIRTAGMRRGGASLSRLDKQRPTCPARRPLVS